MTTTHITKEALLQVMPLYITTEQMSGILARAAELEQSQPAQISHHEDCWRDPKHHACAVAKIEQLQSAQPLVGMEFRDAWYEIAYLLGIGAQNASPKEVHVNQVMLRLRELLEMKSQNTPYVPNLGEDCRECGYQICRCADAQQVSADTYIAAVNGRREFRAAYRKALAVVRAARPFAKIITESSGRIPTERLSLADWHALSKAMKGIDDAQPLASQMPIPDSVLKAAVHAYENHAGETCFYSGMNAALEAAASQMRPQSAVQGWQPIEKPSPAAKRIERVCDSHPIFCTCDACISGVPK